MKKLFVLYILVAATLPAQQPGGEELLAKVIGLMNPPNAKATMLQTIETTSGSKRTFKFETSSGNGGEFSLMRYIEPGRVKGNSMLMTDYSDNIWMYNRRTNRVRKLASHAKKQKFEGSDFTYEDMGSGDTWKTDYSPTVTGGEKWDGEQCWLLNMAARKDDMSYSKMVVWVRVEDSFPIRVDYYDENEYFTKSLYLEDIREIEGVTTPFKMTMKNHLEKTETVMEYVDITYDVEFGKNYFSERNLKK